MAALCCHADYLLLDEAFDGLAPVIRLMVKKLLAEEIAERGATVMISSHNLRELEACATRWDCFPPGGCCLRKTWMR